MCKNIRKSLRQPWENTWTLVPTSHPIPHASQHNLVVIKSVLKSEISLPSVAASAAPHQSQSCLAAAPRLGSAGSLSTGSCDHCGPVWLLVLSRSCHAQRKVLARLSTPCILRTPRPQLLLWDAFSLYWEGSLLHHRSCKKTLSKKCIHASVPLAGPLSKQAQHFVQRPR